MPVVEYVTIFVRRSLLLLSLDGDFDHIFIFFLFFFGLVYYNSYFFSFCCHVPINGNLSVLPLFPFQFTVQWGRVEYKTATLYNFPQYRIN